MTDNIVGIDGGKIRRLRMDKDISAKELGEIAGMTEGMVRHIENGIRTTNAISFKKIADALEVAVDDLYITEA